MSLLNGNMLTGSQRGELNAALRNAFTNPDYLEMMLREDNRLQKNLYDFASFHAAYDVIVSQLITQAEARGFTAELLLGALGSRPDNSKLIKFSEQFELVPTPDDAEAFLQAERSLERYILPHLPDLDITVFRERLGVVEGQVCRVEVPAPASGGTIKGTGFLLGPDVLITNYHILRTAIDAALGTPGAATSDPKGVVARFDYKVMADGTVVSQGRTVQLADRDWLIDHSPYSQADLSPDDGSSLPTDKELDYALVRLAEQVGDEKIGNNQEDPAAPTRGWLRPTADPTADFQKDKPLFIIQHPEGRPLKLTLGFKAMLGLNGNGTRVRYLTNTAGGSSGSPCFNERFDLLALHHSGDPNFDPLQQPGYNQGVPFTAILKLLNDRSKAGQIGG